jgi:predicted site-specific integrase-resolvase
MISAHDDSVRLNVAARELGVATKTVKKYCRCQKLRCRQLPSGHWRVVRSSLDALLKETDRCKQAQTGPNGN